MNPSKNVFECKNCGGQFLIVKFSENYDPTYCPFCGEEGIKEMITK